jgi:hypothetical protein
MQEYRELFSMIGGILSFIALIPYAIAIVKRKVRPTKATWIVWASVDTLTVVGMIIAKTLNWQIVGAATGATVVMFLSFWYGNPGWTKTEKTCLSLAVIALGALIWKFSDPVYGVLIAQSAAFIGSIPIFVEAWKGKEDKLTWTILLVSCVFTLLSVPKYSIESLAQPINFVVACLIITGFLYFKKQPEVVPVRKRIF